MRNNSKELIFENWQWMLSLYNQYIAQIKIPFVISDKGDSCCLFF